MLFNSYAFLIFFSILFILYWFVFKELKWQNILILVSSYIFYGWLDYRFLFLIIFISIVNFISGLFISQTETKKKKKLLLVVCLLINFGFLCFFKYLNFFIDSFKETFSLIGLNINTATINILLPIGISFYIFKVSGYVIDLYYERIKPAKDWVAFFDFVAFFPQLIAGPIDRAKKLLPQFFVKREFDYYQAKDGLKQILWGMFKKVVIADSCAYHVDYIFANYNELNFIILFLGILCFAFQIYCDFSGYSDMAIGISKLLGFNIVINFNYPYFSLNITDFWKRWHISLSTWFRDYLFLPIAYFVSKNLPQYKYFGIKTEHYIYMIAVFITFSLCGLWHGAYWTFVIWGIYHGVFLILDKLFFIKITKKTGKIFSVFLTFFIVLISWVFFRSNSISNAFSYIYNMFYITPLIDIQSALINYIFIDKVILLIILLIIFTIWEWVHRKHPHGLVLNKVPLIIRWLTYFIMIVIITDNFQGARSFIYTQF